MLKLFAATVFSLSALAGEVTPEQNAFFEKEIRPLLAEYCYECHSASSKKLKGDLRLDTREGTARILKAGHPDDSAIIKAVRRTDPDSAMPPKKKLSPEEVGALEKWVAMGAPDPRVSSRPLEKKIDRDWWAFQALRKTNVPGVKSKRWPISDIDHYILAGLEKAGLTPGAEADRRTLIRRATYDLTGLPPTPEEVDGFVNDTSPNAFAKVVDRLLSSPRYGERWGRHWMDIVRYADTAGDNSDFPIPQMHKYRNWVINAFNSDMPYNEFVRQQLAGDLLPSSCEDDKKQKTIATGYIANARRFGSRVDDYPQHLTIEDTIDNLGRAFLGLSVSCARCHDHKFDPITADDYYGLYGIFHSTRYPWPGIELEQRQRDLVPLAPREEVEAALKIHKEKQAPLDAEVTRLNAELKKSEGEAKKKLEKELESAKKAADRQKATPLPFEQAYAVAESAKIEDSHIQLKGDPEKKGPKVNRHFLRVLHGTDSPIDEKSSGRLQLADWLVNGKNPLPPRVLANRIWQYHFGKGIVPTPNDFGKQGKPATHPELLDYLATRLIDSGWSIKSMHRLIMLSRTYQLASGSSNNELLATFPRRRLDAESIRDTLLALGGNADLSTPAGHPFPPQTEWKFTQHNPFKAIYETRHRSVYLMTQRIQRHPYLAIFDGADPAASWATRTSSTTPLQALYLLNDLFVHEQGKQFAKTLASLGTDSAAINRAYQLAFARPATVEETTTNIDFLNKVRATLRAKNKPESEAWEAFARALFRLNEFVYLD